MLKERISRFSLGVICDEVYNAERHVNAEIYVSPDDRKRYARAQIEWFIRKVSDVDEHLERYAEAYQTGTGDHRQSDKPRILPHSTEA